jgi:asparagine synthase (glutamine-hydrolysing)
MCGIFGYNNYGTGEPVDAALLRHATDLLAHRGPDGSGIHADGPIGLGHRRLSIIDLSTGDQPMSTADGRLTIVFNGEIYNHRELRKQLEEQGHVYRTHSDTETLLHLYRQYGTDMFRFINGMFAFAIWDAEKRSLLLARDRIGIKPLYYSLRDNRLSFASELKSLRALPWISEEVDMKALAHYCTTLYVGAPRSILCDAKQLEPGQYLYLDNGQADIKTYWSALDHLEESSASWEEQEELIRERLASSVKYRLESDVPVGAFLSGGIDSTLVVSLMREMVDGPLSTFSIGFEGPGLFDELPYSQETADRLGTVHHTFKVGPKELLDALPEMMEQLDEPFADSSSLPLYYVSKLAREHVKVVLSGDGADEIFAGYNKYLGEHYHSRLQRIPGPLRNGVLIPLLNSLPESRGNVLLEKFRQVKKLLRASGDAADRYIGWLAQFDKAMRDELFTPDVNNALGDYDPSLQLREAFAAGAVRDPLSGALTGDLVRGLPGDMLTKVDRMSMCHSLEVRVPFLDHRLVEDALSIPASRKLQGKTTKAILKAAFKDRLPESVAKRKKHGFDIPMGHWLKNDLRPMAEEIFSESNVKRMGCFNPSYVQRIWKEHLTNKREHNLTLWILMVYHFWSMPR